MAIKNKCKDWKSNKQINKQKLHVRTSIDAKRTNEKNNSSHSLSLILLTTVSVTIVLKDVPASVIGVAVFTPGPLTMT
jgi:hypothetical protein